MIDKYTLLNDLHKLKEYHDKKFDKTRDRDFLVSCVVFERAIEMIESGKFDIKETKDA